MGRRKRNKNTGFDESFDLNQATYIQYYNRLTELAISMFEWKGLPPTIDERFLELTLFSDGMAVFFEDETLGYLCLQCMIGGNLDVYRVPKYRKAYATNGYNNALNENNSVIIFNNMLRTNSMLDVQMFSQRLANLDRAIDVNANAQKTPVLIQCDENQRLTMKNLYMQYDGNEPFIFGDKSLNTAGLKVLKTDAPYVADKLYELKVQYWNEALTYLGISNVNVMKKERMIQDEVQRNQGGTIASRYPRLEARRQACKKINEMFGTEISVDYREDYQIFNKEMDTVISDTTGNTDGGVE